MDWTIGGLLEEDLWTAELPSDDTALSKHTVIARFLAQKSALVYEPCAPVLAALEREGCTQAKFFNCFETQAVGFVYDGFAFLVFRGTELGSLRDW
jgi:hypothetical protein